MSTKTDMANKKIWMSKVAALVFLLGAFCLVFATSCSKKETDRTQKELVVLCGSSFSIPMEELCSRFTAETGIEMVTTIAGSEDFLPLVKVGQEGDILVTHDPYLDYVAEAKRLAGHVQVGFVAPVIAVQPGNPRGISGIEDLARPVLKVALSNPLYSTCGEMVFQLLEKKNIKDAVMKNVENRLTKGHSNLGNLLKTKAVDVVIMWNGVAHIFSNSLEVVRTPYEYDKEVRVHIIGLNYSTHPELLKKFMEFVRSKGPEVFAEHGYVK
jgi:molybdate transport system substrate-binding protein